MDYNEILLQSVDIVLDNRLRALQYDTTVKCKVIAKVSGHVYTVQENGTTNYEATAPSGVSYEIDDYVYVLIPKGDYSSTKIIVGKNAASDASTSEYVTSLQKIIPLGQELSKDGSYGLIANGETKSTLIGNWAVGQTLNWEAPVLGISANFKTLLDKTVNIGDYGLKFLVIGDNQQLSYYLNSSDFIGDPYSYKIYTQNYISFSIANFSKIDEIYCWFYQNQNFNIKEESVADYNNIFVKDVVLKIGADGTRVEDDTLLLSTIDNNFEYNETDYDITLQMTWYNKTSGDKYLGFSDGVVDLEYDEYKYLSDKEMSYPYMAFPEEAEEVIPSTYDSAIIYKNKERALTALQNLSRYLGYLDTYVASYYSEVSDDYNDFQVYKSKVEGLLLKDNDNDAITALENCYISMFEQMMKDSKINFPSDYISIADFSESWFSEAISDTESAAQRELRQGYWEDYSAKVAEYQNEYNRYRRLTLTRFNHFFSSASKRTSYEDALTAFEDANSDRYCIYWYKQNKDVTEVDEFAGSFWALLNKTPNYPEVDDKLEYLMWNQPTFKVNPDIYKSQTAYKVVLIYNHIVYTSDTLVLKKNLDKSEEQNSADTVTTFTIEHGTNSKDLYQKYSSMTYRLISSYGELAKRELKVNGLKNNDTIYWYIPTNLSMLKYSSSNDKLASLEELRKEFEELHEDLRSVLAEEDEKYHYITEKKTEENSDEILELEKENLVVQYKGIVDRFIDGYDCYTYTIGTDDISSSFYYNLQLYYSPLRNNNTIRCIIARDGVDYSAQKTLSFRIYGTNGTEHTLVVVPTGDNITVGPDRPLSLQVVLYDEDGEGETLQLVNDNELAENQVRLEWYGEEQQEETEEEEEITTSSSFPYTFEFSSDNSGKFTVSLREGGTLSNSWAVLKITAKINGYGRLLTTYYEVPYALSDDARLLGPTRIIYNSYGSISSDQDFTPYQMSDGSTATITISGASDITIKDNILQVPPVYLNSISKTTIVAKQNSDIVYYCPILMLQDKWENSTINAWDGTAILDNGNNSVLAGTIGAGYKDSDNKFYGLIMGTAETENSASQEKETKYGLYGYDGGQQSFGLKIDGTMFLGKADGGRILFDGNDAIIKSASDKGMSIDLNEGLISAKKFTLEAWDENYYNKIYLGTTPKALEELEITNNTLCFIGHIDKAGDSCLKKLPSSYLRIDQYQGLELCGRVTAEYGKMGGYEVTPWGMTDFAHNILLYTKENWKYDSISESDKTSPFVLYTNPSLYYTTNYQQGGWVTIGGASEIEITKEDIPYKLSYTNSNQKLMTEAVMLQRSEDGKNPWTDYTSPNEWWYWTYEETETGTIINVYIMREGFYAVWANYYKLPFLTKDTEKRCVILRDGSIYGTGLAIRNSSTYEHDIILANGILSVPTANISTSLSVPTANISTSLSVPTANISTLTVTREAEFLGSSINANGIQAYDLNQNNKILFGRSTNDEGFAEFTSTGIHIAWGSNKDLEYTWSKFGELLEKIDTFITAIS